MALLIRSVLASKKLLLDRSCMERLGRCRCLLGGGQRISEPGNSLGLLLDLPVFYFKLPLQRVDSGLQNCYHSGLLRLLRHRSNGALRMCIRMCIRMRSIGAVIFQEILFYQGFSLLRQIQDPLLRMRIRSANRMQLAFVSLIDRLL